MKIYIKKTSEDIKFPEIIDKGDWIDLRAAEEVTLNAPQASVLKRKTINGVEESFRNVSFDYKLISLGVAMQLPKGFEAVILPRSGTFKNFGVILVNSQGVIDNTYCGNNDEWKFGAVALRRTTIHFNDRICQFKIQLSQKATVWQKLKWLFSSKIKLVEVDTLTNENRGGISSTGIK